jgi:hypothetical protein
MAQDSSAAAQKPLQVLVSGKIDNRRRFDDTCYTRVICPSGDEYTKPQVIEIASGVYFGNVGEKWAGYCVVGGYPNDYETKAGEKIKSARLTMRLAAE